MPTITLEHVSQFYKPERALRRAGQRVEVGVEDVSLSIEQGDFIFVVGGSGSGKSTLLGLIAGELKPKQGRVLMDGQPIRRRDRRRHIGQVWQDHRLVRRMTVAENLRLAARQGGVREKREQMEARIRKVLGLVGLSGVEDALPVELAIGECRRVELARALIHSPHILVLDEITAGLKDENIWDIFHLLTEINRRGTTVVMSTHAGQYVNILRKRVITLVHGRMFSDVPKGTYGEMAYLKRKTAPRIPKR